MRFVVGGAAHDLTPEQVERAMKGVGPEAIRKHLVEMHGTVYPPKQVFATVTGRDRSTFTTQEAQRVLVRLGFVCREADKAASGGFEWKRSVVEPAAEDRIGQLENAVATAQAAIADILRRVAALETA